MRGQRHRAIAQRARERIIPARAGPTERYASMIRWFADHPRSCGANQVSVFRVRWHYGSSPLVRGQPNYQYAHYWPHRIIPARAGPTTAIEIAPNSATDHPRSCGANLDITPQTGDATGSSPLVRGQRVCVCVCVLSLRIIPARAGPTIAHRIMIHADTDHPRSCGANVKANSSNCATCGSSPLVRGQHVGCWRI